MKKIDEINSALEKEDIEAVRKFLHKIYRNWYWFALSFLIFVSLAVLKTKTSSPSYQTSTLLIIKSDKSASEFVMDGFMNPFEGKNTNIEDYIGILTSYSLNRRVLENLDWATSWYRKELFRDVELYGNEPFVITMQPEMNNLAYVPIYISMVDSSHYRVTIDETVKINQQNVKLNYTAKRKFGEAFENEYFNFTVWKKQETPPAECFFIFNDIRNQILNYSRSLDIPVDPKVRTNLITILLEDSHPQKAIDYLNELSNVFVQFGLIEKNRQSASTVNFIDEQLSGVIDTLKVAGSNFTSFRSRNQIVNIGQEGDIIVQKLVELETERSNEQVRLEYYLNLQNYMSDKEKMKQMISPSVVGITDATVAALVTKLGELYSRREIISYTVKDKNPSYILINNEIELATRKLKENLATLINNSKIAISNLTRRIENMNAQLKLYPKTEQELMNIKRSFDLNNELYTFLLKKRAEAAITHASNVPDTQILDQAAPDITVQTGPSMTMNVAVGGFMGLAIPFVIIIVMNYFNDKINSAEEIEQMTSIQVIGNLINNNNKKEPLPTIRHPRSAIAESFRELRTNLRFLYPDESSKVISINSVIPREGKSFTAVNLASMIAINSMKVLLIDCDMRKPSAHKYLSCENTVGLSTYLIGQHERNEIIQKTKIENLQLISGGPVPPNPSEMLETGRLKQLISECRIEYDYIIIDNSPLSLVSDGIIISQFTDINLFVLRQDYSTKGEVRFINHMNTDKSMKNAGIILNDINLRKHAHTGYYGAKYSFKSSYGFDYYFETN
ncbi:GumC family protein [Gaoshiqia sediminis]|uniref:non-specific protein-tyrosine kinase n=1 Tax=Gaoshiqia sediminis TaxID=2986998 RepID=A0AA41Y786_9BACT|nr:tyrosine-protein kinase [Gaoshiqia sediminis]MCW0483150.1 polysaccharide biosynthesis tyrosine autokinase [Gaoshiqia sediminis]